MFAIPCILLHFLYLTFLSSLLFSIKILVWLRRWFVGPLFPWQRMCSVGCDTKYHLLLLQLQSLIHLLAFLDIYVFLSSIFLLYLQRSQAHFTVIEQLDQSPFVCFTPFYCVVKLFWFLGTSTVSVKDKSIWLIWSICE